MLMSPVRGVVALDDRRTMPEDAGVSPPVGPARVDLASTSAPGALGGRNNTMAAEPQPIIDGSAPVAPVAPRRVRKSPNARRAEIVDAARTVFASAGYEDAGLAEISDVAQVSKGLL